MRPATREVDLGEEFLVPTPPVGLCAEAKEVWTAVWLAGRTAYHPLTDSLVIERYAEMQARRRGFLRTLATEGFTSVGSQGNLVPHPVARMLTDVDAKLVGLEDRLGLSPESRIRLGISSIEKESKLKQFLQG